MIRLIGVRWKYSNVLSRDVLIGRVPARNAGHRYKAMCTHSKAMNSVHIVPHEKSFALLGFAHGEWANKFCECLLKNPISICDPSPTLMGFGRANIVYGNVVNPMFLSGWSSVWWAPALSRRLLVQIQPPRPLPFHLEEFLQDEMVLRYRIQ